MNKRTNPVDPKATLFDGDLERSLLGRLLLPKEGLSVDLAAMRPFHFHDERNTAISIAIQQLRRNYQPVDMVSLRTWCREHGTLQQVGGPAYLGRLLDEPAPNPEWCAQKLRQLAARRLTVSIAKQIVDTGDHLDADGPAERLDVLVGRIASLTPELDGSRLRSGAEMRRLDIEKVLREPPAPMPWVIERWLARRDVICLAGEPKVGKSWIALDLARALSEGRPFLNAVRVEGGPYRVMYVDEENNPRLVEQRIRKLANGADQPPQSFASNRLLYLYENALNLDDTRNRDSLVREVRTFKPDWIIFDSLIRFHRRDENSNAAMSEFCSGVLKPLSSQGCGIILLHHLAKPDRNRPDSVAHRLRGASDLLAFVDQLWITEVKTDGTIWLRHERSRWAETAPSIGFRIQDTSGGGVRLAGVEVADLPESIVLAQLREAGAAGAPRPDILRSLKARGLRSDDKLASNHLSRLWRKGLLRKRKEGKVMRYWLADFAPADLGGSGSTEAARNV